MYLLQNTPRWVFLSGRGTRTPALRAKILRQAPRRCTNSAIPIHQCRTISTRTVNSDKSHGVAERVMQHIGSNDQSIMNGRAALECLRRAGLQLESDPRLHNMMKKLQDTEDCIDNATFLSAISECPHLVEKAMNDQFVVQNFKSFTEKIDELYQNSQKEKSGEVASYIPELARVDPKLWGVSLCTVDGQRYSVGDSNTKFTIQSGGKCFNYAVVLEECGVDKVHKYIGMEPSGGRFNQMVLSSEGKPHNPMINSGAMVICSLMWPHLPIHERVNLMLEKYCDMAGVPNRTISCDMITCDSEMHTAYRNIALLHYIRSKDSFPPNTSLDETMKFYTRLCSVELDCHRGAVMAATLANGGVCPITEQKVLCADSVKHTLTLMHSCGMYDYSGEFAFNVGLPAKSGVSGVIIAVIPGVMGLCLYSPPVNKNGNSVRGLHFCQQLVKTFKYHMYDNLQ